MKILGIDPSISSTGFCILEDGKINSTWRLPTAASLRLEHRLGLLYQEVDKAITKTKPDYIVIEDIAHGASRSVLKTVGANIQARMATYHNDMVCFTIPPTSLKKAFTGNGRASKKDMINQALTNYGQKFQNDIADAVALSSILYRYVKHKGGLGISQEEFSKYYRGAPLND